MRKGVVVVGSERWRLERMAVGDYYTTNATPAAVQSAIVAAGLQGMITVKQAIIVLTKPQKTINMVYVERIW